MQSRINSGTSGLMMGASSSPISTKRAQGLTALGSRFIGLDSSFDSNWD